ncbi:MAG: DUF1573 domain-containing protein [Syntrophomonadaceae bacterium]|nr:DUF1573 domain-containing protein [Syntrophomonadaceae bacterium]
MKDLLCDEFQNTVAELLIRHHSILDVLSKSQEATARVNRAVTKAVTGCGCIQIDAKKKLIPPEATLADLKSYLESHLQGSLCPSCQEVVEMELGKLLFYITALCNLLDLNLYDVFLKEHKKISTLRIFNLT